MYSKAYVTIGKMVKEGINQSELAREMGYLLPQYISNLEWGITSVSSKS